MNADAKLDAALGRQAGVALDHAVLHFDRAAHRIDHAAKLDETSIAGALDDASMVRRDAGSIRSLRSPLSRDSVPPRLYTIPPSSVSMELLLKLTVDSSKIFAALFEILLRS
jgi:hypothetical protein